MPGFRLARLAVDRSFQGRGIGGQLLLAAGRRCWLAVEEVGGVVLVIDAKNESVEGWYASYGAVPLLDAPLTLLLPVATIEAQRYYRVNSDWVERISARTAIWSSAHGP
ncbi:MAG TPA: hypothetical protein VKR60_02765 [Candidatus Sulfotelmatobacter sp.]|nr:hypothetical protein [Candidatus Sulfotelmatobacter sp.]